MMDKLEKEMKKNNGIAMPMFGALKYGVLKTHRLQPICQSGLP